jgi:hypothetical protein
MMYSTQTGSEILEEVLAISRKEPIRRLEGERVLGIHSGVESGSTVNSNEGGAVLA